MKTTDKLLLSCALFLLGACGHKTDAQSPLETVNDQIALTQLKIRALRSENKRHILRDLRRNGAYRYVQENRKTVDSLRTANVELIDQACARARRTATFTIVPHTAMVFLQYTHVPGVSGLGTMYELNNREIKKFDDKLAKIDGFEQRVRNHHDSIMYANLAQAHHQLDSLLNVKHRIINGHSY
ncbi:MAG: hypothetical protein K2L94_01295 [Alphaproteobacteria bacterium]|nr:hypothetical protein [Alphaproteobacteria bacterium]